MCWTLARTRLGCFGNTLVLLFGLLFFPVYSLTAIYPQGTGASRWGKKRHEIDIIPLNAVQICRENTVIHWQCLKIKHILLSPSLSLTSYSLLFRLNLLINYTHFLQVFCFYLCHKNICIFLKSLTKILLFLWSNTLGKRNNLYKSIAFK